jgi:hypothetical protein
VSTDPPHRLARQALLHLTAMAELYHKTLRPLISTAESNRRRLIRPVRFVDREPGKGLAQNKIHGREKHDPQRAPEPSVAHAPASLTGTVARRGGVAGTEAHIIVASLMCRVASLMC